MGRPVPIGRMSYAEYLVLEAGAEERHEFLDGAVYAMAGGTPEHGAIAAALIRELGVALQGRPCRVYTSDVRVRIQETGLSTYPDVTVVCGKLETAAEDPDAVVNPVLLVEILSPSTEAYDRGAKAAHYRQIASLQEYVLVALDEPRIEVVRRTGDGPWQLTDARRGEQVTLASVGVTLDVSALFEDPLGAGR